MSQEPVRVVIEVFGGVVQAIYAPRFVEVVLVDWDNINAGDEAGVVGTYLESEMSDETRTHVEKAGAADAQVPDAPEC